MPTRKDKTNVAPIYREQVFIPASGATLMKQKSRPKVAGYPVSSGAIEIVSPEFDLLTGIRGINSLFNNVIGKKLPSNYAYRRAGRQELDDIISTKSFRKIPDNVEIEGGRTITLPNGKTITFKKAKGNSHKGKAFAAGEPWKGTTSSGNKSSEIIIGVPGNNAKWKVGHHGSYTEPMEFNKISKGEGLFVPFDDNGVADISIKGLKEFTPTRFKNRYISKDIEMKCGGRRKAQLGLDIREGGIAIPIANNMFYINGRKHAAGGVAIGPNNKNGVEVEGGEVVEMIDSNHPSVGRQFKAGGQQQTMRVFSSVPLLRGVSPAQLVLEGANPNAVFKAQEEFKDRNKINDDGTTYEMGGEGNAKSKRSRTVTGVLPYGYTIRNLYSVENPYRKGIKGNVAKMYDSRTLGAGVDVVSGHPELYKKAKSGKMTKKQADETAVIHLRKDDNAIRSNYADVYGKAAADTLSYGPRFLVAQARYQQGNVRKAWAPIHKAMAKGDAKALKKAVLQVTPKDHEYRRKWIEDFKVYKMGGMIYEINGNVKNGLNLRPKAKYGTIDKKDKDVKVGQDGLIYKRAADGEWYTDGTKHVAFKEIENSIRTSRRDIFKASGEDKLNWIGDENDKFISTSSTIPDVGRQINLKLPKPKRTYVGGYDEEEKETKKIGSLTYEKNESGKWVPASKQSTTTTRDGGRPKDFGMTRTGVNHPNGSYKYHPLTGEKISEMGVVETSEPSVKGTTKVTSKSSSTPRGEATKTSTPKSATKTTKGADVKYGTPLKEKKESLYITGIKNNSITPLRAGMEKIKSHSSTGGGTQSKDGRWVGQYKTTNAGDWIGLGSNLAGTMASYFMTKNAINKMPEPLKPVMAPAVKLKTKYNIQPQLTNISEAEQMNRAAVRRNTQSSNTSLAREQRLMNEARGARNTLYGQKENIETQLINQDRLNRQSVMRDNVRAYNEYLNKVTATKMAQNEMRASNINNLISGLTGSVNSILGNIESRRATNNTLRAIAAANPNVDARLIGGFDYYIDPITKKKYNKNQQYVGIING